MLRPRRRCFYHLIAGLIVVLALPVGLSAGEMTPEQLEFFESQVRPLLSEHCYKCHSAQAKVLQGGLRLDSRQAALKGGDSGEAIVPGKPDVSNLIQAIRWQTTEMPPTGKLSDQQVAVLVKWVEQGAPWPSQGDEQPIAPGKTYDWPTLRKAHWAWQPIADPKPPAVRNRTVRNQIWPRNEIDDFVLARLEAAGLQPNRPAEPRVLIRRVCIDLTGLPPSPEEIAKFEQSAAADHDAAVAQLVDRLLASPAYGERWGRHWLDVARYSDGHGGFLDNDALPSAWRYRDWVVAALNRDLPYDEFVRLQIAGDLVSREQSVATGFLALGPTYNTDGGDLDAASQAKSETLDDRVDTVTRGLLAMTVACARCHDHRFDPYPQIDYYSLAGVFNNTEVGEVPLAPPEVVKVYNDFKKKTDQLEKERKLLKSRARKESRELTADEQRQFKKLSAEFEKLNKAAPEKYSFVHALVEKGDKDMHVAIRGNLLRPGPIAPRRFLQILSGDNSQPFKPQPFTRGSGRLDLADALVSRQNPLLARVMVNRVWQQHFGQGLVRTASNFGTMGEKPSHAELLDWLAARFRGDSAADFGWSLKRLHRTIVLSATYQLSSAPDERALAVDGDNRLLWRMSPRRLDVEAWRDAVLTATGELDLKFGGPPVTDIGHSRRRTLYAAVSRNGDEFKSDAFLRLFDFPVPRATSEGRSASIVPQQSLFMMNSDFMAARAKALSQRLAKDTPDMPAQIRRAYLLLYGRAATDDELQLGEAFLESKPAQGDRLTIWEQYAQVLLSASELMHLE